MNPYAAWTQSGADAAPAPAPPTITELLASIHALDAEVQRTNYEIVAQISGPFPPRNVLDKMAFVDNYWRPFIIYWDGLMREVYDFEHSIRDPSPALAWATMMFFGIRLRYYNLRRDAATRGFVLSTPSY